MVPVLSVSLRRSFQLPITSTCMAAPRVMSLRRVRPRHMVSGNPVCSMALQETHMKYAIGRLWRKMLPAPFSAVFPGLTGSQFEPRVRERKISNMR